MNKIIILIAIFAFSVGLTFAQTNDHPSGQTSGQIDLFSGNTSVDLSADFVGALTSLNIAPGRVFPTTIRSGKATFQ